MKQIRDGADFVKLVKENSTDARSAEKDGDLGWVLKGNPGLPARSQEGNLRGEAGRYDRRHPAAGRVLDLPGRRSLDPAIRTGEGQDRDRAEKRSGGSMGEGSPKEYRHQDGTRGAGWRPSRAPSLKFRGSAVEIASGCGRAVERALQGMPVLAGAPILIRFLPALRAGRRHLESGGSRGEEVHAGSLVRRREIVLDAALLSHSRELVRILLHELFHFAWVRAGNPLRRSYELLLAAELRRGACGELGWSAERRKRLLTPADTRRRTRQWREYACESFCDTGAWRFAGLRSHDEFTLAARYRAARRVWLHQALAKPEISI